MIVKAPIRGQARSKDKAAKLSSSDPKLGERETKTSGQLTETTACSEDSGMSRQPVCLAGGSLEPEEFHGEYDAENTARSSQDKKPSATLGEKKSEQVKAKKLSDKRDDPVCFITFH